MINPKIVEPLVNNILADTEMVDLFTRRQAMKPLRVTEVDRPFFQAFVRGARQVGKPRRTAERDFRIARAAIAGAFPGRQKPKTYGDHRRLGFKAARREAYGS